MMCPAIRSTATISPSIPTTNTSRSTTPRERARLQHQVRQVTDYIVDNNYQILDWDGERTLWGWFNPELLNGAPVHYLEKPASIPS